MRTVQAQVMSPQMLTSPDTIISILKFNVPESSITVGGVELRGSSAAIAYAKTDGTAMSRLTASADGYNIMWNGVTLTLRDAKISGNIYHNNREAPSIRLVIEGVNSITEENFSGISQEKSYEPSLAISGGGTLEISAGNTGINAYSVTVESGTLEINAGQYGIGARGGLTIKGGEIRIASGTRAFFSDTSVTAVPPEGMAIAVETSFSAEEEPDEYLYEEEPSLYLRVTHTSTATPLRLRSPSRTAGEQPDRYLRRRVRRALLRHDGRRRPVHNRGRGRGQLQPQMGRRDADAEGRDGFQQCDNQSDNINTAIMRDTGDGLAIVLIGENTVIGPRFGVSAANIRISGPRAR